MGNMSDARAILVAKHKDLRAYGKLRNSERFANWFWGVTIGHGYAPGRVCFWIVGWVFFGWLCYLLAYGYGVLTPSGTTHEGLVPLQLFLLATDKFLPGGDLGQAAGWQVDPDGVASSVVHALERAYRLVGWFFTAIAAAALVGLLKKE
jgi:hypothetical protein